MSQVVTNTAILKCNMGATTSKLEVTSQDFYNIQNKPVATEKDKSININIMNFGKCKLKPTTSVYLACSPIPLNWENTAIKDVINNNKILIETSTCKCAIGGIISIENKGHNEDHDLD